jgi:hypothetical protein
MPALAAEYLDIYITHAQIASLQPGHRGTIAYTLPDDVGVCRGWGSEGFTTLCWCIRTDVLPADSLRGSAIQYGTRKSTLMQHIAVAKHDKLCNIG